MAKTRTTDPLFATEEVPLYYQLGTLLREQIVSGRYGPEDRLPTEAELVADYGVSRITVRQALKALEEEGLIRREAGRGTFVTSQRPVARPLRMEGTLDDLITLGMATSVKLLEMSRVKANSEDVMILGVPEDSEVFRCARLRYYRSMPYSHIINRLPLDIAEAFADHDWETGSILRTMEENLGLRLEEADQTVRATLADASLARLLETRIGAPLLMVDRVVRTDTGRAVERVHTAYRGEIYSLSMHLTREPAKSRSPEDWTLKHSGGEDS